MDDTPRDDDPRERFGPYVIEELLGRGGIGEVHRAYDTVQDRYVALKRLSPTAGEYLRARFRREAEIMAELADPHVVPIHDIGEINGRPYLDMRLVEGTDLARLLAVEPLDPGRATRILIDVAKALDAAHSKGVLHRDVKPANILVDADDVAYLTDFGIARRLDPDITRMTEEGLYVGTPDYMAPERLRREDAGSASDVYSLACVLFHCLTGVVPFPAQDPVRTLAAQLNDAPPAPSLFSRRVPSGMDLVVRTGMDKEPGRRYATAGDLMAAAAAALGAMPATRVAEPLVVTGVPGQTYFVRVLAAVDGEPEQPDATVPTDTCPYPGLRSFGTADSAWFFGREQALRDLLARLVGYRADSPPLLVVGASGAGKSSLLYAGLLAARTHDDPTPPRLALTPGERPIETLAARMAALAHADPQRLARQLYHHPESFGEVCRAAAGASRVPLLVVVDQLEELFTQCADLRERESFAAALTCAWPARVVLAVRADFVEQCIRSQPLRPALDAPYVLGSLTTGELADVITKPARAAGLALEPGLVDRLLTDVRGGHDPGALPRLAHVMRETWRNRSGNRLTLAGYQATGGVDRAVALTADGFYTRLADNDRRELRTAILHMVTILENGGIARGRAHRGDLPPRLLEDLIAARLVAVDHDHVTLAHEAILVAWPRLGEWVAEDRQNLLLRQQLREAADKWRAGGQDRGDLYRGARLLAALDWSAHRLDLSPQEWTFLQASDRDRRRRTRRLRGTVTALAVFLVLALVAGTVALIARDEADRERDAAERQRNVALSRQYAGESLAEADVDPVDAMRKALRAWRTSPTQEARGALLSAAMLTTPSSFDSGVDDAISVDVNHDGTLIAVGSSTGEVVLWDVEADKAVDVDITGAGHVTAVRFSPDGTMLAVSSLGDGGDWGVAVWELPAGRVVSRPADLAPALGAIAWRPDGQALAAASPRADGTIWIGEWDPRTGRLIRWVADNALDTTALAYGADGDRLAVGHADGGLELWEPATGTRITRHDDHRDNSVDTSNTPVSVAMAPGLLASASPSDHMIRFWNPRTGEPVREMRDVTWHSTDLLQGPTAITFAMDGALLYTNSDVTTITAWDPLDGGYRGGLPQGPYSGAMTGSAVLAVAVSQDDRTRVAARADGTVTRWRTPVDWLIEPTESLTTMAFDPLGERLTAGDSGGTIDTWRTDTGQLTGHAKTDPVFAVAYTEDGTRVTATATATFTVTPPGRRSPRTISLDGREFRGAMAVSPDGRWLAAAHRAPQRSADAEDQRIEVWDVTTLTRHATLSVGEHWPSQLTFSPDSDTLLSLADDDTMSTWDVPSFTPVDQRELGADTTYTTAYTPGGDTLLTAGTAATIELRDPVTGRVSQRFGRHPATVRDLAISPDGRTVATVTTSASSVYLWDLPSRTLLAVLNGHSGPINEVAFSPDGTRLASAGSDTDIALWYVDPEQAAARICHRLHDTHLPDSDHLC